MGRPRYIFINLLAILGLFLTSVQILLHLKGQELCFNQGCKVVENILDLNPLVVNGLGALFFLGIILFLWLFRKKRNTKYLVDLLLLCGFCAEGILLSIQLFIAHTFCSYCLLIALLILIINVVYSYRTAIFGMAFISVELALFSFINVPFLMPEKINLNQGTYAVKTCSNAGSVAFLIFSEDCPHCKKVLKNLQGCVKCEIHFNPVSRIKREILPGLIPIEGYRPEINVLALRIFDINSVPVLIQRTEDGYKIIKGDKKILEFIKEQCFCPGSGVPGFPSANTIPLLQEEEGLCSLNEQCK